MNDAYEKHQRRAVRHEAKYQRAESPNPVCWICGTANVVVLTGVPCAKIPPMVRNHLHIWHHPAGRGACDWQVLVCRNCAEVLDDARYDWEKSLLNPQTLGERVAAHLQGMADMHRKEAEVRLAQADELEAAARDVLIVDKVGRRPAG